MKPGAQNSTSLISHVSDRNPVTWALSAAPQFSKSQCISSMLKSEAEPDYYDTGCGHPKLGLTVLPNVSLHQNAFEDLKCSIQSTLHIGISQECLPPLKDRCSRSHLSIKVSLSALGSSSLILIPKTQLWRYFEWLGNDFIKFHSSSPCIQRQQEVSLRKSLWYTRSKLTEDWHPPCSPACESSLHVHLDKLQLGQTQHTPSLHKDTKDSGRECKK